MKIAWERRATPPRLMREAEALPHAFQLLVTGYFHQDWDLNGANAQAVLERFVEDEAPSTVAEAHDAAVALSRAGLTEDELESWLDGLGFEFVPASEGLDHRQWLDLTIEVLARSKAGADS